MSGDGPRWLIVMTGPRKENLATYHLRRQGFRVWWWHCMQQSSVGRPEFRRTRAEMASYFPRYLFMLETKLTEVVEATPGVSRIVRGADVRGAPVDELITVSDPELRILAAELGVETDGYVIPPRGEKPEIPAGTRFRFADEGPFHGLLGQIAETAPLDGRTRLKAYLDLFGRQSLVEVPPEQVGEIVE